MIELQDWGLIDYHEAWDRQKELVKDIQQNRDRSVLVLCEHPTVITVGRNGTQDNIKIKPDFLGQMGVPIVEIDRGGDVTLHNPGQLVGYPIFDLSSMKQDLHWFLREVEECIIDLLGLYGLDTHRIKGLTGVWIDGRRKLCAMGMHCSRWVTSHGFALNVLNNMAEFSYIVPCGITDKEVSSVEREVGTKVDMNTVKRQLAEIFLKKFRKNLKKS